MSLITEKQASFRIVIRDFAESELKPIAYQLDQGNDFPYEVMRKLGKKGMMAVPFPASSGGAGLDYLSAAIAVEELARVDGGTALSLSTHLSLACYPLYTYGSDIQKLDFLLPMTKGEKLGALAQTEINAGSDAGAIETTAKQEGTHYVLNGSKSFVTNAPIAQYYIVTAVTTPDIGSRGITAFILDKNMEGITFGDPYDKLGARSSSTAVLNMNNVQVPRGNRLGKEGDGFRIAMSSLDGGRIGVAALGLGLAQGAYEEALTYAKERKQFGKPIASQQAISFKLAEMATQLRACRLMVYSAALRQDQKEEFTMEAAMAKQYVSEQSLTIINDALQIIGGMGYLKGVEVERAYRDARITTLYEGSSEIQRMVIASHIIGPLGKEKIAVQKTQKGGETGTRKQIMLEGTPEDKVDALLEALVAEGYDFSVGIPMDTPIGKADRVVCAGLGIGSKENMNLAEELAKQAGGVVAATRPVAETLNYIPLNCYVGMSGQKFNGNLFISCGASGAMQYLKGAKDATTIVAINVNKNARIFKNCDYGIVGDVSVIMPLLAQAMYTGEEKAAAPPMVKMKKIQEKKPPRAYPLYICNGCAYEYDLQNGDPDSDTPAGTSFVQLPETWVCPECSETKDHFIEI